jgi:DNA-binding response OmpR family regulator
MSRILIIDDDQDLLAMMRLVLETHHFEVETATTPDEGLAKVVSAKPDLVVLDVMMPVGLEGFEVARALREEHHLKDLPIIILTNIHNVRKVPYRFAPDENYLPVDLFMDKPIDPDELVNTIKEILGERREEPRYPL